MPGVLRNSADGWGIVSRTLHWLMVALLIAMLAFGQYIAEFVRDEYEALELIQMHKSWGFVAFVLAAVRIAWRLWAGRAELPAGVPGWQRIASQVSHILLYALMVAIPVTGWLYASASEVQDIFGIRNEVFGLFELPDPFRPGSDALARTFHRAHEITTKLLLLVVAIHFAAALKHHFVDRDNVLRRMWSGAPSRR